MGIDSIGVNYILDGLYHRSARQFHYNKHSRNSHEKSRIPDWSSFSTKRLLGSPACPMHKSTNMRQMKSTCFMLIELGPRQDWALLRVPFRSTVTRNYFSNLRLQKITFEDSTAWSVRLRHFPQLLPLLRGRSWHQCCQTIFYPKIRLLVRPVGLGEEVSNSQFFHSFCRHVQVISHLYRRCLHREAICRQPSSRMSDIGR